MNSLLENQITALKLQLNMAYQKEELMRKIGGANNLGFFQYYFDMLPGFRTKYECFNHVNEQYFDLFGEYRYTDYNSFRKQYNSKIHKLK